MKKAFFCGVVLVFALTTVVFANRRAIDDTYKAYEAVVVEAENLAKKPSVGVADFSSLAEKAEVLAAKAEKVQDDKDFTAQDAQRFSDLDIRYRNAWETIMKKLKY